VVAATLGEGARADKDALSYLAGYKIAIISIADKSLNTPAIAE
jgi:hypothetical protein